MPKPRVKTTTTNCNAHTAHIKAAALTNGLIVKLEMNTIGKKQFTPLTLKLISPTLSRWLTEIQIANSSEEERVRATGTKNKGLSSNSFRHGRAEDMWGVYSRADKAKKRELQDFAREHRTSASVVESVYTDQTTRSTKRKTRSGSEY